MQAYREDAVVAKDRSITLRNLPFREGEEVEVILIRRTPSLEIDKETRKARGSTAQDLLHSPLVGLWKDRDDIEDSSSYARRLREQAQHRTD